MMTLDSRSWLRPRIPDTDALLHLVCFPHAGGGAGFFNGLSRQLIGGCAVVRVQLPGREDNREQPPAREVGELIPPLLKQLRPLLNTPMAFYGHSMGAIVAFELVRELRRCRLPLPVLFFVSGRRAPQLPLSHRPLFSLPDDELMEQLRIMGASSLEVFERPKWREYFLPTLRADLEVSDLYQYDDEAPLPCPIFAFGGVHDETVKPWEWRAWRRQSSAEFVAQALSGRHFFDRDGQQELIRVINTSVSVFLSRPETLSSTGKA